MYYPTKFGGGVAEVFIVGQVGLCPVKIQKNNSLKTCVVRTCKSHSPREPKLLRDYAKRSVRRTRGRKATCAK